MDPIQAWRHFQDQSPYYQAVYSDGEESVWKEIAHDYDDVAYPGSQIKETVQRILLRLKGINTLIEIGAGPGTLTVPLAGYLQKVTAVEPSEAMSAVLLSRLTKHGISNVAVVNEKWETVNLPSADGVLAGGCLYVFYHIDQALTKMCKAARFKIVIAHIGNDGLWDFERRLLEKLRYPMPCLFPGLELTQDVLKYKGLTFSVDTYFVQTKKTITPTTWERRCRQYLGITGLDFESFQNWLGVPDNPVVIQERRLMSIIEVAP